jgi:hypothetical protein
VFTDHLSSNGRPIVARVCFRGNVFTDSFPRNGYTRHNKKEIRDLNTSAVVVKAIRLRIRGFA